jgi:DNA-binding CsgD family transcriptional regulator
LAIFEKLDFTRGVMTCFIDIGNVYLHRLALRTVQRAEIYLSEEVAAALRVPVEKKPPITRREKEVLQLIAQGYTNIEIAEQLFISTATVNTHRKSLLEKFEAKNTAILIGRANKLGIV